MRLSTLLYQYLETCRQQDPELIDALFCPSVAVHHPETPVRRDRHGQTSVLGLLNGWLQTLDEPRIQGMFVEAHEQNLHLLRFLPPASHN